MRSSILRWVAIAVVLAILGSLLVGLVAGCKGKEASTESKRSELEKSGPSADMATKMKGGMGTGGGPAGKAAPPAGKGD